MKIKYFLFIGLFGMLAISCNLEKSIEEYMVDSWETTYLKIEMPTYQKSDSVFVFEDAFKNNPERRAQSIYNNDGTFSAWFINQEGEKKGESKGKWSVKNDSLYVEFFYTGRDVKLSYYIEKTVEGFKGTNIYDWDKDGEFDDILLMKAKRIKSKE